MERSYDLNTIYRLDDRINRLETIVDLGGNTGLAAAYLTARYRPETLLSVEPIPANQAMLRRNRALSGMDWIVEDAAVAGTARPLDFAVSGFWDTCTAVEEVIELRRSRPYRLENVLARPSITVPARTVADLLEHHHLGHVDLLKVDVEGSEAEIFAAPQPWMRQVERIVLEVHDKYIDGERVRDTMRAAGFRRVEPRAPHPEGFNPVELYVR